jgi:hypothetical protein
MRSLLGRLRALSSRMCFDMAIDAAESLCAGWSDSCVVQALSHRRFTIVFSGALDAILIQRRP